MSAASLRLLEGRTVLVTGVLRPSSIATHIAAAARDAGARVLLTAVPATVRLTARVATQLGLEPPLLYDATAIPQNLTGDPTGATDSLHEASRPAGSPQMMAGQHTPQQTTPDSGGAQQTTRHQDTCPDAASLVAGLADRGVISLDGLVHCQAYAAPALLGGSGLSSTDIAQAERAWSVSVASLSALTTALRPLLAASTAGHPSVLTLSFDTSHVYPSYGWMGPLKAALEASVRYLAADCGSDGIRVNAVSAGILPTMASRAIPGYEHMAAAAAQRAPLGWGSSVTAPDPAAAAGAAQLANSQRADSQPGDPLPADSQPGNTPVAAQLSDADAVARTAVTLLSDALPVTTGAVIPADGGAFLLG